MATKLSEEIDRLLEHYLGLLDQYDTLRSQLSNVQSALHQHLARANFEADRGIRYGADLYDARMQASRLCRVTTVPETGTTLFTTSTVGNHEEILSPKDDQEGQGLKEEKPITTSTEEEATNGEDRERKEEETKTTIPKPKDPIRMFGILTPPSLRIAQSKAIETVENIIPKLVSIDAELKDVEIRIRRARKHKAKAEAMKTKQAQQAKGEDPDLAQVAEAAENAIEEKAKVYTTSDRDAPKKPLNKNRLAALVVDATAMQDRESRKSPYESSNEKSGQPGARLENSPVLAARARFEQWNKMLAGMTNKLQLLRPLLRTAITRGPTANDLRIIGSRRSLIDAQFVELWASMKEFMNSNWHFCNRLKPLSEDGLKLVDEFAAAWNEVHALFQEAEALARIRNLFFYLTLLLWGVVICMLGYAFLNHYGL